MTVPSCPAGCQPFRTDGEHGMPLFVPQAMLNDARAKWPEMWIEPIPFLPGLGKAITHADWEQSLKSD